MTKEIPMNQANRGMKLNIEQGSHLAININGMEGTVKGILVGQEPHEYLIVRILAAPEMVERIETGTRFQLSYLCLDNEYGFESVVLGTIEVPFRLAFISYPEKVNNIDARQNNRVSCYIPATMRLQGRRVKGVVSDISRSGCRFVVKLPASLQARQVRLIDELELLFPLMGMKGMVNFNGRVRNTTIDSERIVMGIEFQNLDARIASSIGDYINNIAEINAWETGEGLDINQ